MFDTIYVLGLDDDFLSYDPVTDEYNVCKLQDLKIWDYHYSPEPIEDSGHKIRVLTKKEKEELKAVWGVL